MARIFTTPEAEQAAKAWLHDLTVAAGIRTNDQRSAGYNFFNYHSLQQEAQQICNELLNRDFVDIDSAIKKVSNYYFCQSLTSNKTKRFKPDGVAKCIVYMAELLQVYWDDTIRTPYEITEFKKTLLGDAVYRYKRYISAVPNKSSRAASSARASASRAPGQPPKNNYKQSGPQSGNVRDLIDLKTGGQGTPGEKIYANTSLIYKIIGDNPQSKNTPNVFIKPLSASGAAGNTNKIFISSGNGYTDCTCYFDDPNDAQNVLDKIIADNRVPANVTNMRVVKMKADTNGYFLVGTEYGPCAISAKTLNEALNEEMADRPISWEKATEGYSPEELEELHTWMRRG